MRGVKGHVLTCSFGLALAVFVSAANLHGTHGPEPSLGRAARAGWDLRRVGVDAIYAGPTVHAAGERHGIEVRVSARDPDARGFAPLPVRWRVEPPSAR